jgi:hypothetical protein
MKNVLAGIVVAVALSACATPAPSADYTTFRQASPKSILVVPALNNTVSVDAADVFHSTVSRPFAERGYYVFPAHMVKSLLEQDGLSDAALVHSADPKRLGRLFGCDAVLYITIDKWESQYVLISTSTNVAFQYKLKSCVTGADLWDTTAAMTYSPQSNNNTGNPWANLIAQAVTAALEKAAPNYIPLAQQANFLAANRSGMGLPAGPYLPKEYGKDTEAFPSQAGASVQ